MEPILTLLSLKVPFCILGCEIEKLIECDEHELYGCAPDQKSLGINKFYKINLLIRKVLFKFSDILEVMYSVHLMLRKSLEVGNDWLAEKRR